MTKLMEKILEELLWPSIYEALDSTISIAKAYAVSHVQEAPGMTLC